MAKRKKRRKPNLKSPNSMTWRNKADDAWGKAITAVGKCEVCGTTDKQLHPHHLIGRTNLRYRHTPENGICLCATHHTLGGYNVDICAHGDLSQVSRFLVWLSCYKNNQYSWWNDHRQDKRQREESYEEAYRRLTGE